MAHRHEGLGLARQQLLEPEDAVDVEVVGRLVEQQQLGLAHQLARDGEPLLPAARERLRLLRLVREAGPSHRDGDLAVALVRVEPLVRERLAQHRADARARLERGVLRHVADAQALACGARARRRRLEASEDLQQRRLARAVRAHEADVVVLEDAEREALEERRRAEGLAELLAGDEQLSQRGSARRFR